MAMYHLKLSCESDVSGEIATLIECTFPDMPLPNIAHATQFGMGVEHGSLQRVVNMLTEEWVNNMMNKRDLSFIITPMTRAEHMGKVAVFVVIIE